MNLLRRNIDIVFSCVNPERVIAGIKDKSLTGNARKSFAVNSRDMDREYYNALSRSLDKDFSHEEILCMYDEMKARTKAFSGIPESFFQLLIGFAKHSLRIESGKPVCKRDKVLSWRSVTLNHGQDLFTCAYMAYLTLIGHTPVQREFDWPAIIETDDKRLKNVLHKGIAENHFHLVGSTRVFTLSWVALMNNPEKINHFFNRMFSKKNTFTENRSGRLSFLSEEIDMSWNDKLLYAAWIRSRLFCIVYGCSEDNILNEFDRFENKLEKSSGLIADIRALQYRSGRLFRLPNGEKCCLDYTICKDGSGVDSGSPDRLLCGERELIYRMLLRIFGGQSKEYEQDLFYAYLLLKNAFRSEIIQVNREVGFANFSLYQDRKDTFWEGIPAYWYEAQRLAVNSDFRSGAMHTLEMRVQLKESYPENYELVLGEDRAVLFSDDKKRFRISETKRGFIDENNWELTGRLDSDRYKACKDLPFFYVMHFIKKKNKMPAEHSSFGVIPPRNSEARYNAKVRALELAVSLHKSTYLRSRIRGIDAASFEVGCRPETFATEFRFLSDYVPEDTAAELLYGSDSVRSKLGITYHAGEDFLDITDGLRAIDEAIRFLHLKRGDRIGHALALGVDPKTHFIRKHGLVTTNKQDMLDNYVWILKRGFELGISFDHSVETLIRNEAENLFREIYGECIKRHGWRMTLDDYYDSWKLRGDNPMCYRSLIFRHPHQETMSFLSQNSISFKYYNSFVDSAKYNVYRDKDAVSGLMHYYHFGYDERKKGMETCSVKVIPEYVQLVCGLQDKMQRIIAEEGIMIECNPSSNQLIGTFGRYENYPLFRFNGHLINTESNRFNISVSVNTDDQGVFDTSLENEYAIIADCMAKLRDENNQRKYSDDMIYDYLDHIRGMGMIHTFSQ